eukprot:GHVO01002774.1.p1 GENE.GHVO01002774.1~~GHVO01002774.1.p1  ORF type:complete len:134 (-),score=2.22 GHVO01002774.1:3-404(-)
MYDRRIAMQWSYALNVQLHHNYMHLHDVLLQLHHYLVHMSKGMGGGVQWTNVTSTQSSLCLETMELFPYSMLETYCFSRQQTLKQTYRHLSSMRSLTPDVRVQIIRLPQAGNQATSFILPHNTQEFYTGDIES